MDELILFIVAFFPFSLVFYFIYTVIKGKGGSKGITDEYTSKSGIVRTAKKSREEHSETCTRSIKNTRRENYSRKVMRNITI